MCFIWFWCFGVRTGLCYARIPNSLAVVVAIVHTNDEFVVCIFIFFYVT